MAFEPRNNSGAIFKNERKEKDTHPDYRGNARIEGVDYEISAWVKEAKGSGKKYFSLAIKPKPKAESGYQNPHYSAPTPPTSGNGPHGREEDLPF